MLLKLLLSNPLKMIGKWALARSSESSRAAARFPFSRAAICAPFTLALAACGGESGDTGPGAVSEGEAQALDEAAEMLDERRLPPEVLPTAAPDIPDPSEANGESADESTGDNPQ